MTAVPPPLPKSFPGNKTKVVRVTVTRIEQDGTMQRRMVDTAQQHDGPRWEDLTRHALAIPPPYRPVPGAPVYHIRVDDAVVLAAEQDLTDAMLDLITGVLSLGEELLPSLAKPALPRKQRSTCCLSRRAHPGAAAATSTAAGCCDVPAGGSVPWSLPAWLAKRVVQRAVHRRMSRQYQRRSAQALPPSTTIEVAGKRIPHSQQEWTTSAPADIGRS
jgi:hypothetical protein